MPTWMQRLMLLALLVAYVTGCNTMAGFGRDVETLGNKIEQKAVKHRY